MHKTHTLVADFSYPHRPQCAKVSRIYRALFDELFTFLVFLEEEMKIAVRMGNLDALKTMLRKRKDKNPIISETVTQTNKRKAT